MFETVINLLIAGLFWQSQLLASSTDGSGGDSLPTAGYRIEQARVGRLPQAEIKPEPVNGPQRALNASSLGVAVTAKSVLVTDRDSKTVLFAKNADEIRPIASLTKLMTALVFLDYNPGWDQSVTIEEGDHRAGAFRYLQSGETMTVKDVFYTALIISANEAAVAMARSTGLTAAEFVAAMNAKAKDLGLDSTSFVDVVGLDERNLSTVRDLIVLFDQALNQPDIMKAVSAGRYDFLTLNDRQEKKILSTNWILGQNFGEGDDRYWVEAGKTGHLIEAGYCFLSQIRDQRGRRVLSAVLGSETVYDRFSDTKGLAYWVFKNYVWP